VHSTAVHLKSIAYLAEMTTYLSKHSAVAVITNADD